jgi:hypothetical protein
VNLSGSQENYKLVKKNLCPLLKNSLITLTIMLSYHNLRGMLRISYVMKLTYIIEKTKGPQSILLPGGWALAGNAGGKRNS